MKATLVLGFLGAGKTTLLRRILAAPPPGGPLVVVVNDFGDIGIDGTILAGAAVETIELASGCVCCSLRGALIDALQEIDERLAPERVIVEASGVAVAADLIAAVAAAEVSLAAAICVVDAARFARLRAALGPFYADQIAAADVVLVNKIDLAATADLAETLAAVRALAPAASVIACERADIDTAALFTGASHRRETSAAPAPHVESLVLAMARETTAEALRAAFRALPGEVWRVKGFVRVAGATALVQYAGGEPEIVPAPGDPEPRLVFIGPALDAAALAALFEA